MTDSARMMKSSKQRPDLEALLEKTRGYVMTSEDKRQQARSWVRGEMMLEHPELTKEQADVLIDEHLPELRDRKE